jgi:hypothetical protein
MTSGNQAGAVTRVVDSAALGAVFEPNCLLAHWDRALSPALRQALAKIDFDAVDDIKSVVHAAAAQRDIADLLAQAGYGQPLVHLLTDDIANLVRLYCSIRGLTAATLRLEMIDTDACRRFHADYVSARLLTTYVGRGTQWIHRDDPTAITEMPAGTVAIFKGTLLAPDPLILHRSPPIAGSGEQRLLLVLDADDRALD